MKKSSRAIALEILSQWQESHGSIDLLIEKHGQGLAEARDRQLVKAMTLGVLRLASVLDWVLARFCKQPLKKVNLLALQALRIGTYQILFMDRVPVSAAINETVEALKMRQQPRWLVGFVNGVLRNVARQQAELAAMLAGGQVPAEAQLNHPAWLLARWRQRYGEDRTRELCLANAQPAQLCLRLNTPRTSVGDYLALLARQNIAARPGAYVEQALWLEEVGPIKNLPGYEQGLFAVQDEIAQLLCYLLAPFAEGDYLDGCAGLGGKTAVLAQLLGPGSNLYAVEPDGRRQQLFAENMARLGISQVALFGGELAAFAARQARKFRGVLLDVPCSGLGVTGRHPDIRWNRQPADLKRFQGQQLALLGQAAPLVEAGGVMVYATCSTEPEENEEVVAKFLHHHPEFQLENAREFLPANAAALVSASGFLQTVPGQEISDGFFGARLKKAGN